MGPVPKNWHQEKLGDIAEIVYGAQAAVANATDSSIGTLILTNVNISLDGNINLEKKRYYRVPDKHRDRLMLRRGDVLFNWRSGSAEHVGKTAYFDLDGDCTYSSFILRFRPRREVSSKFLFRYLTWLRSSGFFSSQRNVSSINSVYNASLAATIPIWFPQPDEQAEIASILDATDLKIQLHKRRRALLDELFSAVLHKLMTGELRVADLDQSVFVQPTISQRVSA
jgi:type I restriction enzyme S subunit